MEVTITLQQQREMLTNAIARYKAEGKAIELENTEYDLCRFDEARPTGLKYKDLDGKVYEVFSWSYISHTGGKKWQHGYKYESQWGVITGKVYKKECFK
jgi:hypothetical protein